MQFPAEQHLAVAKLLRQKGVNRTGEDRERFIKMSNSFVICAHLSAANQGGVCLDNFDWLALQPDWVVIEKQLATLSPPLVAAPPLVPT
jgi:hypothetical protein